MEYLRRDGRKRIERERGSGGERGDREGERVGQTEREWEKRGGGRTKEEGESVGRTEREWEKRGGGGTKEEGERVDIPH